MAHHQSYTTETAASYLNSLLKAKIKSPPGAILIKGAWGCGKTYFWKEKIDVEKKYIYLSLFGLCSVKEIEDKIVAASLSLSKNNSAAIKKIALKIEKYKKLSIKVASKFSEKKYGISVEEFADYFEFNFNIFKLIPENSIICLDDIERISVPYDQLMGLINKIILERKAKIVLIANEEKIKKEGAEKHPEYYFEFKEKVIWTTISIPPDFSNSFDSFTNDFAREENHSKIFQLKNIILATFEKALNSNLRHLQKAITCLDQILVDEITITESHCRFFISLIIHHGEKGFLHPEPGVYFGSAHYAAVNISKKALSDFNEVELASKEFADKFYPDSKTVDFSNALFNYIYSGILNIELLKRELNPTKTNSVEYKILEDLNSGKWIYAKDEENSSLIKEISLKIANHNNFILINNLLRIYQYLVQICKHNDFPLNQIEHLEPEIKKRIKKAVLAYEPIETRRFFLHSEEEVAALKPYLEYIDQEISNNKISSAKENIKSHLTNGKRISIEEFGLSPNELIDVFTDPALFEYADSIIHTDPEKHFTFYQDAARTLNSTYGATEINRNFIIQRIDKISETSKESGLKKRLSWLKEHLTKK